MVDNIAPLTGSPRVDLKETSGSADRIKDQIFRQQLISAIQSQTAEREKQKTYAETVDKRKYQTEETLEYMKPFTVKGDNKFKSLMWSSMMRDATFYYDNPTVND